MALNQSVPVFKYVNIRPPQKIKEQKLINNIALSSLISPQTKSRYIEVESGHKRLGRNSNFKSLQRELKLIDSKVGLNNEFANIDSIVETVSENIRSENGLDIIKTTLANSKENLSSQRLHTLIAESYLLSIKINENASLSDRLGSSLKLFELFNATNRETNRSKLSEIWEAPIILPIYFITKNEDTSSITDRIKESVYDETSMCPINSLSDYCTTIEALESNIPSKPIVKVLGIADLNVIKQKLLYYKPGEIAHIENVLKGEEKTRSNRDLKRSEELYELETESIKETQNETSSTDRFEMRNEMQNQQNKASQIFAGVNISSEFGTVSVDVNASYAQQNSNSQKNISATNFNRSVTNRALERVQDTVREKRSLKTITEVEKIQSYELSNIAGLDHTIGVFRYLDKTYENQVYNYGARCKFQFLIPNPAGFIINSGTNTNNKVKPISPLEFYNLNFPSDSGEKKIFLPDLVDKNTYEQLMTGFGLEIKPMPGEIRVSHIYHEEIKEGDTSPFFCTSTTINIEEDGYEIDRANVSVLMSSGGDYYIDVMLNTVMFHFVENTQLSTSEFPDGIGQDDHDFLSTVSLNKIPVLIRGKSQNHCVAIDIICKPTDQKKNEFFLDIYNKINNQYKILLTEYNDAKALEGISIEGDNPQVNRIIEQEELKKWCIESLSLQRFDGFDSMVYTNDGHAEIDFVDADNEGKFISFFENVFDWKNMTYEFYDYMYGNKSRWLDALKIKDNDPIFQKFLRAGAARVIVPINPTFEKAALFYLETQEIYEGADLPLPENEFYISIIDEIQSMPQLIEGVKVGDPVTVDVPTSFVMLTYEDETKNPIPEDLRIVS